MRKPRDFEAWFGWGTAWTDDLGRRMQFRTYSLLGSELSAAEAHRLSHWLSKAAAWIKAGAR